MQSWSPFVGIGSVQIQRFIGSWVLCNCRLSRLVYQYDLATWSFVNPSIPLPASAGFFSSRLLYRCWYCPFGKRHSSSTVRESECECARARASARAATNPKLLRLELFYFSNGQARLLWLFPTHMAKLLSLELSAILLQCNKTPPICYKSL